MQRQESKLRRLQLRNAAKPLLILLALCTCWAVYAFALAGRGRQPPPAHSATASGSRRVYAGVVRVPSLPAHTATMTGALGRRGRAGGPAQLYWRPRWHPLREAHRPPAARLRSGADLQEHGRAGKCDGARRQRGAGFPPHRRPVLGHAASDRCAACVYSLPAVLGRSLPAVLGRSVPAVLGRSVPAVLGRSGRSLHRCGPFPAGWRGACLGGMRLRSACALHAVQMRAWRAARSSSALTFATAGRSSTRRVSTQPASLLPRPGPPSAAERCRLLAACALFLSSSSGRLPVLPAGVWQGAGRGARGPAAAGCSG